MVAGDTYHYLLYFIYFSKRKGNHDLAMAKLKEGNINAATEMFQVLMVSSLIIMAIL